MLPMWLIEAGVYGDEALPLLDEVRRQGMAAEVVPHQSLRKGSAPVVGGQPLVPEGCVLAYGTFPFAQQILLHHRWLPGAWCSAENLDCARYFAYFGRYLLNQHYAIMPGVEAIRQRDWLFSVFGRDERVFARPEPRTSSGSEDGSRSSSSRIAFRPVTEFAWSRLSRTYIVCQRRREAGPN